MWLFRNKEPEPELKPPVQVGQRFKYLGVEMLCTRHGHFDIPFPVVVADYVSNLGKIETSIFYPCDWPSLESELSKENK